MPEGLGRRLRDHLAGLKGEMVAFLMELAAMETPSTVPESQDPALQYLASALQSVGMRTRRVGGQATGGQLLAVPARRARDGRGAQLMIGHVDTVWPVGTLKTMPLVRENGRISGPGVFDMKGGLTLMVFALRALRELGLEPPLDPVVFVNTDEEIGSPESQRNVIRVARAVRRAFVIEPPFGPEGKLKTARKGVGQFELHVTGKAAHAGLDPYSGASAIVELAHAIQALDALNDRERGITVNVGVVEGGLGTNVIAPSARAQIDLRVLTVEDGERLEAQILGLAPVTPGVTLAMSGGIRAAPMEATARNQALWHAARSAGEEAGLDLEEVMVGGGSDGNTTSQFTATLDGMGPVGDGAHAPHEFILEDSLVDRCAVLARLLLWDADGR